MPRADLESTPDLGDALTTRGLVRRTLCSIATAAVTLIGATEVTAKQTEATIDAAGSVVEYDGFLVSGAATVSPTLRFNTLNASWGLQGSWVVFESGNQIIQANAAGAWLTPGRGPWRAEFSGSAGLSQYAGQAGFGHLNGRARLHWYGQRSGGWVSAGSGWTFDTGTRNPIEVGAGGWTVSGPFALAGNVNATWVGRDSYVDLVASGRWSDNRIQVEGELGIRPWSASDGDVADPREGGFAELSTIFTLTERLALMVAAGSYPSDPPRGTLGAEYLSVGLRIHLSRPAPPNVPTISRAVIRAADALAASDHASRARLEMSEDSGDQQLRVMIPQARSVELMGDFTDWEPVSLSRIEAGVWQIALHIPSGVHRLNVRIDGGPWLVPLGTRLEEAEFGGGVGIIIVP